jgi:hypothetical protein
MKSLLCLLLLICERYSVLDLSIIYDFIDRHHQNLSILFPR